eukprot:TRINITY_DN60519_c0_g1_i1.p1 TRINITY_DN60519_c0_g1~~TRINITY_DN60519_c0_g1_i1.p1  ORF type:complete len:255 (+),score=51.84 TRINITY_DN60519_c0_g1_i1:148-912(+)
MLRSLVGSEMCIRDRYFSTSDQVKNAIINVLALQTVQFDPAQQNWFTLIYWFVGTMWIVFLLFPLLLNGAQWATPLLSRERSVAVLLMLLFLYFFLWLGCNGNNGLYSNSPFEKGFYVQASPWVKVWIFCAGMAVGRLLVGSAVVKDTLPPALQSSIDKVRACTWGKISDLSGLALAVLTFGPPYYSRDFTAESGDSIPNPAQWGYFHQVEIYAIFPAQLLTMVVFLYALLHNRGMVATVLDWEPVSKLSLIHI